MSDEFWSRFFWLAGSWNVAVALAIAVVPGIACRALFRDESNDPLVCFLLQLFALAVGAFGIGYTMVGSNIHENRAIVLLGGACKVILLPMSLYAYLNGFGTGLLLALIAGDMIWASFFGVFLVRNRK